MTKITVVTCIIAAVCVFQTAEAGLFDPKSIDSLLGNIKVPNPLGNINLGDKLKNGLEVSQKGIQTPECIKIYNEGQKVMSELMSIFSSCVSNETNSVGDEVQNLTNAVNNLRGHIKTGIETGIMCIQHPLTIPTCIYNIPRGLSKLAPDFKDIINVCSKLSIIFPNVGLCYQQAFQQTIGKIASNLITDVEACTKSLTNQMPFF